MGLQSAGLAVAQRFRRLWQPERKGALATPDSWLSELFGALPSAAGINVSPRVAMTCTPVRCAVQAISEAIGQLPVITYQRNGDGSKQRAPDHSIYGLLHDEANEWTPASHFREHLTRDALLYGDGYGFINRVEGKPVELHRLDPTRTVSWYDFVTGEPLYTYSEGTEQNRPIRRQDILHIRAPSIDGIHRDSPIIQGKEAIAVALVMERHASTLFANGGRPSGILRFQSKLGVDVAARIKAAWLSAHGGSNTGGTAVLEEGAEFQSLALTSVDSQFMELRAFAIEEIARLFRVPPIFLMEYGRATWGNSEEMGRQFLTYCLMPWIKRWEGEIRLKLFAPEERNTYFAEFLTDDLLRADLVQRAEAYGKLITARVLNPNEARAAENRPPYAGGDAFLNPNTTATTAPANSGAPQ